MHNRVEVIWKEDVRREWLLNQRVFIVLDIFIEDPDVLIPVRTLVVVH